MRPLIFLALLATGSHPAMAGAWPQQAGAGMLINKAGYAMPDAGDDRWLNEGYMEWGVDGSFTAVVTFDSVYEPATGQSVWHATAGARYSLELEDLPGWSFGLEPRVGYQFHESAIADPVFAGDGFSYGVRFDIGRSFEVWNLHAFTDLGIGAATRSQAEGEYKLEFTAGIDLAPDWQAGIGYFGTLALGRRIDPGAYSKQDISAYLLWRFEPDQAIAVSVARTIAADRTAPETAFRVALWMYFAPEEGDE